jgi:acylphosphatase
MAQIGYHCFISGVVQGVWFRASTQEQARALHITGWVRNLPDGRVELKACGESVQMKQFLAWLHNGPPGAAVSDVDCSEISPPHFIDFTIS